MLTFTRDCFKMNKKVRSGQEIDIGNSDLKEKYNTEAC